ncbi:MAG: hypothetical protein WBM90_04995 [Acidimicrobiia bacterium]
MLASAALAVTAFSASAASLGGISTQDIFAQSSPASVSVPTEIAQDDFDCNGSLDGQTDSLGNVWTSHVGNWQCLGSGVVRSQQRQSFAHATVDISQSTGIRISTDLERISTQSNRSGPGLALFADGIGHLLYVIYERDQDRVILGMNSPTSGNTILNQIDPISDLSSGPMSVEISSMILTVLVNGSLMTYDLNNLNAADRTYFLSRTRFGLVANNDNFSRFESFAIETLP